MVGYPSDSLASCNVSVTRRSSLGHIVLYPVCPSARPKHFRWWNVFDDMCRMGRRSFWSWFDVNRYTLTKNIFAFSFPVTLIFDLLTSNLLSKLPVSGNMFQLNLKFLRVRLSYFSSKSETRDERTDRRTDGVQHLMQPLRKGRITTVKMLHTWGPIS